MHITPTVGRVVWFYPAVGDEHFEKQRGPFAAMICHVNSDSMISVIAFNQFGESEGRIAIYLVQDGQGVPPVPYCAWMPYQIGQAKKHGAA